MRINRIIVAGNYREFNYLMRQRYSDGDPGGNYYVSDPNQLRGMHNVPVEFYGTYYLRPDIETIERIVMENGLEDAGKAGKA